MSDRDFDVILFGATGFTGTHIIHVSQHNISFLFSIYMCITSLLIYTWRLTRYALSRIFVLSLLVSKCVMIPD